MRIANWRKINIIFQSFLHLVLVTVQALSFAGLLWVKEHDNSTFYVTLATCAMIAGVLTVMTGIYVAILFWISGQKGRTVLILFQSAGAFLSIYLYRNYLYMISNPDIYSPAKWMLTPYIMALFTGMILLDLNRWMKTRHRFCE